MFFSNEPHENVLAHGYFLLDFVVVMLVVFDGFERTVG